MSVLDQVVEEHQDFLNTLKHWHNSTRSKVDLKLHHKSEKYYQYIPLTPYAFLDLLVPLLKNKRSFLDVGCGMGDKLRLVSKIAPNVKVGGIEFHQPYVKKARLVAPNAEIIHMDAFNYADYHKWDVIYAYRPIMVDGLMGKLEEVIMRAMKRRATFAICGPSRTSKWVSKRLKPRDKVWGHVWCKP